MLKKLSFEVTFAHTGKTLKGDHTFEKGMTAITGANETGKSMRIEMFRFAWFGAKALRSQLSTYSSLSVKSTIEIGGVLYEISRNGSNVKLMKNNQQLAAGTKAVNDAVIRIFGYDMEVFDVSNACLQGEVEAMTNKSPAERKRMVDRTIGLDAIDDLIKDYTTELSAAKKSKEALEISIGAEPQQPTKPELSMTVEELEQQDIELQAKLNEKHQIETELNVTACQEPKAIEHTVSETIEELYEKRNQRGLLENRLMQINSELQTLPNHELNDLNQEKTTLEKYLADDMPNLWHLHNEWRRERDMRSKVTNLTIEELDNIATAYDYAPVFSKIQKLEKGEKITCPHCTGEFSLNHDEITKLKAQATWGQDFNIEEWIHKGAVEKITSRAQAELAKQAKADLADFLAKPAPQTPAMNFVGTDGEVRNRLNVINFQIDCRHKHDNLIQEKTTIETQLSVFEDVTPKINKKNEETQAQMVYDQQITLFKRYKETEARLRPRLEELKDIGTKIEFVRQKIGEARLYELQVREYEIKSEHYKKVQQEIQDLEEAAVLAFNIRKGLNELKPKVKSYLIPSLSRVASNFLSEMTNSQRNTIDIDDNFEIIVDGQPVETLSGSGKAVANLAVRLALGTVLTNKVFSVLLVDEVDASMDDERAKYTAQCLRNLTKVFSQIVLVSHQKPEADHYIIL